MEDARNTEVGLPKEGKIEKLPGVFLHYTSPGSLLQIMEWGLVSKSLADRARIPYHHANIPLVQEEKGFEWISVWDPEHSEAVLQEALGHDLVVVTRKRKTHEPANAERSFDGEWLVKNRVRPKDVLAIWARENFCSQKVGEVVAGRVSWEDVGPWIERLTNENEELGRWWRNLVDKKTSGLVEARIVEDGDEVKTKQVARELLYTAFVRRWLSKEFGMDMREARVANLLSVLAGRMQIDIGVVKDGVNGLELEPLDKFRKGGTSGDDWIWDMMGSHSGWYEGDD